MTKTVLWEQEYQTNSDRDLYDWENQTKPWLSYAVLRAEVSKKWLYKTNPGWDLREGF
jgi:hypothetical protein